jgi:hypothetical protein
MLVPEQLDDSMLGTKHDKWFTVLDPPEMSVTGVKPPLEMLFEREESRNEKSGAGGEGTGGGEGLGGG